MERRRVRVQNARAHRASKSQVRRSRWSKRTRTCLVLNTHQRQTGGAGSGPLRLIGRGSDDACQQRLAGAFDEIEYPLEAIRAAIVRIGNFADTEVGREIQQQADMAWEF